MLMQMWDNATKKRETDSLRINSRDGSSSKSFYLSSFYQALSLPFSISLSSQNLATESCELYVSRYKPQTGGGN